MNFYKALASITCTILLIWALQSRFGSVPPLGKFLNPVDGFWQNAESKNEVTNSEINLQGLTDKVIILYDAHMVPHIFANNDHDLYFAQGFVTAKDRLWQMDIQTRSAAGRLSEVVGVKALELDRYRRRMGMVYGAERSVEAMMKDPVMRKMVEAYTAGINCYIHQLKPRDYPIEFKLLDYAPEDWKPINCAFLLKLMSETLTGGSDQFAMTNSLKRFGPKVMNDLFPDEPMHQDPIIPTGTKWDFTPLDIPKPSAGFIAEMTDTISTREKVEGIGSNNWAISGSRTASGYPILANDPHLALSLPSLWYQMQLCAPGVNVNGATLPGAPGVIVGYNKNISWGVTNTGADVLDWYQVKFKNAKKNEYWYNNQWNKVKKRIEVINIRGYEPVTDTVIYTHHGPVVYATDAEKAQSTHVNVPVGNALRWVAHEQSNDIMTFYYLNRAKNYADYRAALTYYTAPAQNFVFASNEKDIAITPNGKFPLKYHDQGKYILDGSNPADDWHGWIPSAQNPTVKNPPRGFVSSANQTLTDNTYPYYTNWNFGSYERGKRINDRLGAMHHATVDSLRLMQSDTYSIRAQDVLPAMLKYLDTSKMNVTELSAANIISHWDKFYSVHSIGATIFNNWWTETRKLIWDNKFANKNMVLAYPGNDRTEQLILKEPNSKWFDDVSTSAKETCADILNRAFKNVVYELARQHGKPNSNWEWGKIKQTEVKHLGQVPGFGSGVFEAGGWSGTIDALTDGNGPSWRMVVEMGPVVKGYSIIPGGESGNPGSFYYDDMLQTWKDGKLNKMMFMDSPEMNSPDIKKTVNLLPGK